MKILHSFTAIALLAGSAAYAQAPAPKAPVTTEKKAPDKAPAKDAPAPAKVEVAPKDVEQFLAFYNKFVDTVVAAKEDCVKLTKDINTLIDANGDMLKKIQEAKAAKKDLPQAAKDKMMARVKEMMPAMQKCGPDKDFQAAMKRMEGNKTAAATPEKTPAKTTEPAKTPAKTTAPTTKTTTPAPAKAPATTK